MSHLRKIALQREHNREVEDRRKAAKIRARESGIKGANYQIERAGSIQPAGGAGWFKRILEAMDPRKWKSKKTLEHEAEVARTKAEREAAEAAEIEKALS